MPPSKVQVVHFCKYMTCNIRVAVCRWDACIWFGGAWEYFALGPHTPLNLRLVSFSFSTETKDLFTGFMAIKKRRLERGRAFSLDVISFFFPSGLQLNTVSRYVYRIWSWSSLMRRGNL